MPRYAFAVVLSAFLLFLVEPIVGRILLPEFGGAAAVWAACLLFFQLALLLGYLYGHWVATKLTLRMQALVHGSLLLVSLVLLPLALSGGPASDGSGNPTLRILWMLALMVGLPFLALAASTPLLQAWYARGRGAGLPYRLFAFSNAGSLAGLLCYPVLVEPYLSLRHQTHGWAAAYGVFALLCGGLAVRASHDKSGTAPAATEGTGPGPRWRERLLWVALAACSSSLLLAVTNLMTKDVAPVPFLWILPLSLYLLSFIVCFAHGSWYRSSLFGWLATPALFALAFVLAYSGTGKSLALAVGLLSAGLFICCMFCHGELARLKPEPKHLTQFYLMVALGGALGAVYVALIAPWSYSDYYEFPVTLAFCAVLVWRLTLRNTASAIRLGLTLALIAYVCDVVYTPVRQARVAERNFYGTLKVIDTGEGRTALRTLLHGTVRHGSQWLSPERRRQATAYYGPHSGGALAIQDLTPESRRVGIVGLGPGTLAAYGRPGDYYRFYELNPLVIQIARSEFTYLGDCPSKVDIVEGDARLSLEGEPEQHFDVLVLDAFSGDSVPMHLLSREAFQLYFRHLKPGGVLAAHVSNRFLDLTSVVGRAAGSLGLSYLSVLSLGNPDEQTLAATWVLVSANRGFLNSPVFKADGRRIPPASRVRLWTDDYSNLFMALR
jgi:SAM-dependent methyltransferase/MFS family permease